MRVIAGEARGVRLVSPSADLPVRPTLDRVRESLFNILGPRLAGTRFLDLFTGTGANGIEALSRGAAEAVLVDSDAKVLSLVAENLQRTRLQARGNCMRLRLPGELARVKPPFEVVYADPPHEFQDWLGLLAAVDQCRLLAPEGRFILEHHFRTEIPEQVGALTRVRAVTYGKTTLSFFLTLHVVSDRL